MEKENVVIIGASNRPDRYSYQALKLLTEHGHTCLPVHPEHPEIDGVKCFKDLKIIKQSGIKVHTVTIYVNPSISTGLAKDLLNLKPNRVIFNPGSENVVLTETLNKNGIATENACTLVLLKTGQF
ncbi:MAG: CoA-binding protein [Bdellovibrio sp.]|nr:CoA-binding protein [Bdellovibrio sp.]